MRHASRQSGRISIVAIAGVLCLLLIGILLFSTGESPRTSAAEFMSALAKGDVDGLTKLSVVHQKGKDEIRKEWERSIRYGRSYLFAWAITSVTEEKDNATVGIDLTVDPLKSGAYPEHKELTMVK